MSRAWLRHAALALVLASGATGGGAQSLDPPYTVDVWASVLFGPDGRATEYTLQDEARYPAKFAEQVLVRVARAKIEPPQRDGKSATLRTGVRLVFEVTPKAEGGTVRMVGLSMSPLPTLMRLPSYPADIASTGGWEGEVTGHCTVNVEGQCTQITTSANAGMPESVRRYMKIALEGWRFEPQQIDGQKVEAPYSVVLKLNTLDTAPEDFRQDKFARVLKGR